jgi:hypothetical protein
LNPANQTDLGHRKVEHVAKVTTREASGRERRDGWIERNLGQAERIPRDASGQRAEIPFASEPIEYPSAMESSREFPKAR